MMILILFYLSGVFCLFLRLALLTKPRLKLPIVPRLDWNSQCSFLCLLSSGIMGIQQHTHFIKEPEDNGNWKIDLT
jgi:hypothetical protein